MTENNEYLKARQEYLESIKRDLIGPGAGIGIPDDKHEVLLVSPHTQYVIGILFPQKNHINTNDSAKSVEEDDFGDEFDDSPELEESSPQDDDSDIDENLDEEISLATQNMPSSMGYTFFVEGSCDSLICELAFGTYRRCEIDECVVPCEESPELKDFLLNHSQVIYDDNKQAIRFCKGLSEDQISLLREDIALLENKSTTYHVVKMLLDQLRFGYVRIPHEKQVVLAFENNYAKQSFIDGINVELIAIRRTVASSKYSITLMLVNSCIDEAKAENCLFQASVRVNSITNTFVFSDYNGIGDFSLLDSEEQSLALQYRNNKSYGSGLGTSIDWDIDSNGNGSLYSVFFPEVEVPQMDFDMDPKYNIDKRTLSMRFLSDLDATTKATKIDLLRKFSGAYLQWIEGLESHLSSLPNESFVNIAKHNIEGCKQAFNRIVSGVDALQSDDKKWNAFLLANRAMFMQRIHLAIQDSTNNKARYPGDDELSEILLNLKYDSGTGFAIDNKAWRPFQLAFILMSIDAICNDEHPDRNLVDLIWFPTGGGKTEAYLGLTAFTIFYRRMAHLQSSPGTTVLMRYTLRLLAAQQFVRASTLICACEYIRKDSFRKKPRYKTYDGLGEEPITIGLWIGGDSTPTKNEKAREFVNKLVKSNAANLEENKKSYNKFQVLKCPWCGTSLIRNLSEDKKSVLGEWGYRLSNNGFRLNCPHESCDFNKELPIQVIDEELYKQPPTLLFGTVDKFAMLPWIDNVGSFFGIDSSNRPPELIIQDELHLISGPLGTMVGLYETVIDSLCSTKNVRPKIVASTATIRRAVEQCAWLYGRPVAQFPHPGLDANDSFFAFEKAIDHSVGKYGRLYVGLMPSGATKAKMEGKCIASLLQLCSVMNLPEEVKDKLWTLTVYFNSLKDLGKCSTLIADDVKDNIRRKAIRSATKVAPRLPSLPDELTSRVPTVRLNETLDKLEKISYSHENMANKRWASDILLATNMISVGIDIKRLNVMLMVGQPKLTSEYIQASSRVGRSYPGIVFVQYDGTKSRDRSHYEQFKSYHESFYRYVEPTGVTPFSKPARDRALHAIVISLARYLEPSLRAEANAQSFGLSTYASLINAISDIITNRVSTIRDLLSTDASDETPEIRDEINAIALKWELLASQYAQGHFVYGKKYMFTHPTHDMGRLLKQFNTDSDDPAFDTTTSMRNVDSAVPGNVLIWEDK